ncbi:hypothetical protein BA919_08025 [Helicobacter pullorum]|uniref:hypothetical protein n=1 Tax=Helicobacter pullorum TaxID=35818 RepID=UPI000816A504|nr:hypothetical protein [Helicobacter pullorum]OCR13572.1 hypothetical protein BA919_08025 [Helicobacter pullorum]
MKIQNGLNNFLQKKLSPKQFIFGVCLIPLPVVAVLFGILWLYDPLQLFHKPIFRETTFFGDMRLAARGIIWNYDFDSVILGTSMLENTSAKEAGEKLGGKWVNLSLWGSAYNERAVILEYLFGYKKPQKIIYSLESFTIDTIKDSSRFDYLYDGNPLDDFKIYLNDKFMSCALEWKKSANCIGRRDLEELLKWSNHEDLKILFGGFEKWLKYGKKETIAMLKNIKDTPFVVKKDNFDLEKQRSYIQTYVLDFVAENPQTQFFFIVPTYSRLGYLIGSDNFDNKAFYNRALNLKWFVQELEKYPNAKIYGFDTLDYADDIANYKDFTHYNVDMNSLHLDSIKQGKHILDSNNIDSYLKVMEGKIKNYDLKPFIEKAKTIQ